MVTGLVGAYFVAGSMIIGYIASTNWVEVPAKIHTIRLISNYDSDSATTYTVKGSYSYDFDGINYQNDRVSLNFGADSARNYWQKLERSLLADQKDNEAIAIVNPNDPAEAVLDRTLRWTSMLFGLILFFGFGGVGCFLMWSSLSHPSRINGEFGLLKNDENGIHSNKKSGMAILGLIFAGITMIFFTNCIT